MGNDVVAGRFGESRGGTMQWIKRWMSQNIYILYPGGMLVQPGRHVAKSKVDLKHSTQDLGRASM